MVKTDELYQMASRGTMINALETPAGRFELEVWCYEKRLLRTSPQGTP
jgi:hypothetical protein